MEKFNDEFGDLSEYKILSFEEISQGFSGNKSPLKGLGQFNNNEIEYQDDAYINLTILIEHLKLFYRNYKDIPMNYNPKTFQHNHKQTYIMDENGNHIDMSAKIALTKGR